MKGHLISSPVKNPLGQSLQRNISPLIKAFSFFRMSRCTTGSTSLSRWNPGARYIGRTATNRHWTSRSAVSTEDSAKRQVNLLKLIRISWDIDLWLVNKLEGWYLKLFSIISCFVTILGNPLACMQTDNCWGYSTTETGSDAPHLSRMILKYSCELCERNVQIFLRRNPPSSTSSPPYFRWSWSPSPSAWRSSIGICSPSSVGASKMPSVSELETECCRFSPWSSSVMCHP